MNKPLISVILPVYNIEDYLQKCMNSLYAQTYKNLELVVVDDGSGDACANLCDLIERQDDRVVVYHKENGGLSDARNYGIERAKGEYIACVDPDDYVDEDYIEYLYSLVETHNTLMSVCQHRVIFPRGKIDYGGNESDEVLSAKECIERMLYHDVIDTSAWSKLYHKSAFDNIEYPKGKLFEDIATTYKLFLKSKVIAVGYESKYNYMCREDSIVNSSFSLSKLDLLEMTDEMANNVVALFPDLHDAALRRMVYARFSTLNQMIGVQGFDSHRKSIVNFIKSHSKEILFNRKAPIRDKAAIISLLIGYSFYEKAWKAYAKAKR